MEKQINKGFTIHHYQTRKRKELLNIYILNSTVFPVMVYKELSGKTKQNIVLIEKIYFVLFTTTLRKVLNHFHFTESLSGTKTRDDLRYVKE